MEKLFDVFGVGNAIVDMLAFVPEELISKQQLARGSMTLMDTEQQARILHALRDHKVELASGGSAANTMVAIAQSGGTGIYSGKVAHDTHGEFYRQDMDTSGIKFEVQMASEPCDPTGTCVVLTTPDAERTMCTYLGVSTALSKTDLDTMRIGQSKISYIEGYLWDAPGPRGACIETMEQSKRHNVQVAFTFSDSFLVDRYLDEFKGMVREFCDILFCNADEARRFCETDSLDECASRLGSLCELVFLTDSENGCRVVNQGSAIQVDGFPVMPLDTVGAGDAFAGGVLYGLTNGMNNQKAARWGNYIASRVVQINGPRLAEPLARLICEVVD